MKLGTVTIENFGCYRHKRLEFGHAPLVLVYGPNESGKTTTLNGIRQALFGFPLRTSYLQSSGKMKAQVQLQLRDGSQLEFTRQKARTDLVSAELNGQAVGEDRLRELMCNLDLDAYAKLFGFSLEELRQGEEALRTARLSEALTGGGLGGVAALQRLQNELQESLAAMYKSRGSTSTINQKLAAIKSTQEQLRRHEVLPTAVQELREQLLDIRRQAEAETRRYEVVFRESNERQRLLEALPVYREYRQQASLLEQIEVPSQVDGQFSAELRECLQQQEAVARQVDSEMNQLRVDEQTLLGLGSLKLTEPQALQIELLGHQAESIAQKRTAIASLRQQHATTEDVCRKHLDSLGLEELNAEVRSFSVADPEREQLELLSSEFSTIREEMLTAESRLETLRETTANEDDEETVAYAGPAPDQLRELQRVVEECEESERLLSRAETDLEKRRDSPELIMLAREASRALRPGGELECDFLVPTELQTHQAGQDLEQTEQQLLRVRDTVQDAVERLQKVRDDLSNLDQSRVSEPMRLLNELLERRDSIIQQWLDDLAEPLIAASLDGTIQAQRLHELQTVLAAADQQQAAILEAADQMAVVHQLQKQIAVAEREVAQRQSRFEQTRVDRTQAESAWRELWSGCPVIETSPENLLQWRTSYLEWSRQQTKVMEAERELEFLRTAVTRTREIVREAWPTKLNRGVPVVELKRRIDEWETTFRDFQREQQHLKESRQKREKSLQQQEQLAVKLEELKKRQRLVLERYGEWLKDAPVGSDWPIEHVVSLLDNLDRLRREDQSAVRLEDQIVAAETELQHYQTAVQQLSEELEPVEANRPDDEQLGGKRTDRKRSAGSPLLKHSDDTTPFDWRSGSGLAAEQLAKRWLERLQKLREQDAERIRLTATLDHRNENLQRLDKEAKHLQKRILVLCERVGRSDTIGIRELLDRVEEAEQRRRKLAECRASLQALTRAEQLDDFLQKLSKADPPQLELENRECELELKRLEESRKLADQEIGGLSNQIAQLGNNAAVLKYQQALQNQRGELAELSEQWIVDRFAKLLLEKSIERFASEHEPVLLERTKQYLAILTGGKYVDIEQESNSATSFLVRDVHNAAIAPDRLSTGTREQLYLAIRMAFITYHSEMQEPLPVIMDDCFVNFDDERTRYALTALRDWSPNVQTIVLSCHRRFLDLMADIAPDAHIIHLAGEAATTGSRTAV